MVYAWRTPQPQGLPYVQGRAGRARPGAGQGAHLLVPLDLGVDEGPEDVGGEGQVRVDQLRLLVQAVQREVIPKLHRLDGVLLLRSREPWSRLADGHGQHAAILLAQGLEPAPRVAATQPSQESRGAEGMEDCR